MRLGIADAQRSGFWADRFSELPCPEDDREMLAGGVNRLWRSACGQTLPSNVLCKARQEASASIEQLDGQPRTLKIPVLAAPSICVFEDVFIHMYSIRWRISWLCLVLRKSTGNQSAVKKYSG
jgi:hypothetical protein